MTKFSCLIITPRRKAAGLEWSVRLRLQVLRFSFVAKRPFTFPLPASNKLRGLIGKNLWDRGDDTYGRFFMPSQANGPSGLSDPPRPFVLRAAHLDGLHVPEGGAFHFDLHLFDLRRSWTDVLAEALKLMVVATLEEVTVREPFAIELDRPQEEVRKASARFLTPMELKTRGGLAEKPEFGILAARVRDRISTLSQLYGDGPLPIDFAAFGERAARIEMTRCEIQRVEAERRSGRTGQTHSLGGFVGEADYAGDLTEFMPYLVGAQWTGVGRQTSWGKGAIALQGSLL